MSESKKLPETSYALLGILKLLKIHMRDIISLLESDEMLPFMSGESVPDCNDTGKPDVPCLLLEAGHYLDFVEHIETRLVKYLKDNCNEEKEL